jgi:hypothetical protein
MSEIAHRYAHVSDERSGADRKGTLAVRTMLQGCGAGVLDVHDVDLSLVMPRWHCLFHGEAFDPGGKQFSAWRS